MNLSAILTKRENEVAHHIAWGASKKLIAKKFFISIRTVENTARNIYSKIQVNSKGELSAWWFCKTFNIPQIFNPLLSLCFMALITVNEIYGTDMIKKGRVKTYRTVKIKIRNKKKEAILI